MMDIITMTENIKALTGAVGFGFAPYRLKSPREMQAGHTVPREQLLYSRSTPAHPRWVYIESVIENMVEQVMLGQMTPTEAIENAQHKIDEIIKD